MTRKSRQAARRRKQMKAGAERQAAMAAQITELEAELAAQAKLIAMMKMDCVDLRQHCADLTKEKARVLELLQALLPLAQASASKLQKSAPKTKTSRASDKK